MARITNDDVRTYGPELIELVEKKALDAVEPYIVRLQNENEQLKQRARASGEQDIRNQLDRELPSWRETNVDQGFLRFLQTHHPFSGRTMGEMLRDAFSNAGSAARVIAIFKAYTGGGGSAATSRASGQQVQQAASGISQKDITKFYDDVRRGYYSGPGREADKKNAEAWIEHAVRNNLVVRVK